MSDLTKAMSLRILLFRSISCLSQYSRTSLIRRPKGQSEVSALERCPYKRAVTTRGSLL